MLYNVYALARRQLVYTYITWESTFDAYEIAVEKSGRVILKVPRDPRRVHYLDLGMSTLTFRTCDESGF